MEPLFASVIAFAFSQVLLSIVLLWRVRRQWSTEERLLLIFLISVLAYLMHPVIAGHWSAPYLRIIENAVPGFFWLLCCRLFDDQFRLAAWSWALVAITVLFPAVGRGFAAIDVALPYWLYSTAPQALEFVLLGWAMFVVVRYWRDDLVEARRELRFWFCALAGSVTFILIVLREIVFPGAPWLAVWQYLPVGILSFIANVQLMQLTPGVLHYELQEQGASKAPAESEPAVDVPKDIVEQLEALMNKEHAYREIGLTIGQLADKLALPEYRLRKIINSGLGYRNFSDYLNGFRIKDASDRLADLEQAHVPILSIALDTGFRSLSSFNKAFRQTHTMTPSEYRKKHISDPA